MIGVYVSVPVACFRKGFAREYLETEAIPPPATCYGFLLSLVGETDRRQHLGCRVGVVLYGDIHRRPSVVMRKVWRVRFKEQLPGESNNSKPDYQQLHTESKLVIWLDSSEEENQDQLLEERVRIGLERPETIQRYGGLCLGESTHLVDEVLPIERVIDRELVATDGGRSQVLGEEAYAYVHHARGNRTLPVWVDHVGSRGTVYTMGRFERRSRTYQPILSELHTISDVQEKASE